ncbi:MAG: 2-dehydropantoate 2-reductase [Pseudomonadota bacterium]
MPSITLIGPGAIGATVAAWLSQNPSNDVSIAVRTAFDSLEVATPKRVLVAHPRVFNEPAQATPADWVLVATKAYHSAAAASWFATACDSHTRVAVIQNGVEHVERFEQYLPRERIVPVMIDVPADRTSPGKVLHRAALHIVVPADRNGAAFVELFAGLGLDVVASADFRTAAWRKLCLNSAGAVCAALLKPAGIVHHDGVAEVVRGIVRECIAVGRAEGATLEDSIADGIVECMRNGPREAANSMLADRRAGRPMEIDARNDVIVRLGRKHGISTPINALMVAMLEAAQDY